MSLAAPSPSPLAPAATFAPPLYLLSDLGAHLDGAPLLPVAINDAGEICVHAAITGPPPARLRGFHLSRTLRIPVGVACGQPPATCLSHNGHVAGAIGALPSALRAWASHLGEFGAQFWPEAVSVARGVNSAGQVVANVRVDAGAATLSRAFVLDAAGPARPLLPPEGGTTIATGLNDAGDVVFNAAPLGAPAGATRAWLLRDRCHVRLAGLGGGRVWAAALTPQGRVVGHAATATGEIHAFLWEDGESTDLGTLPGGMSEALAANDQRIVVGRVRDPVLGSRAFRWTAETGLVPLEENVAAPHGWRLQEAVGINRAGHIVGRGTLHGEPRGFVLKPAVF